MLANHATSSKSDREAIIRLVDSLVGADDPEYNVVRTDIVTLSFEKLSKDKHAAVSVSGSLVEGWW